MTIMASGLTTTAIPDYMFEINTDRLSKRNDIDRIWVYDVEVVFDNNGVPDFESNNCIGGFIGEFHHYDGDIDARPQLAMSLNQIVEIFGDIAYSVHLAGTVTLEWFLEITNRSGQITDNDALFTIEVRAVVADDYALLNEVTRRLIHHDIWESAKNIAQP